MARHYYKMKTSIFKLNHIKIDLPFKNIFLTLLAINIISLLSVFLVQGALPPVIPLLYGLPKGENQLVPKILLVVPFCTAALITLINIVLIKISQDNFSQKALLYLSVSVNILALFTVFKIVNLVGSF